MKRIITVMTVIIVALLPISKAFGEESPLKSDTEKLSYSVGLEIGTSLQNMKDDVDINILTDGLVDGFKGNTPLLTPEQAAEIKQQFIAKMQEKQAKMIKELADKNLKEGEAFLAENKKRKGVITTASGLQYEILREGDGEKPKQTDTVKVHYRGKLINGDEFDSSYERDEPAVFPVSGVIPGWTEALQLMNVGSKHHIYIPAKLAYGEQGAGRVIGPNATLDFEVELLSIEEQKEKN